MRFFADEMLGKLARWLRFYGLDVRYQTRIPDVVLTETAIAEGRVILTRDTRLVKALKKNQYFFITENYPHAQVKEFHRRYPELFENNLPLSRCAVCNVLLRPVEKESVKDRVWPYVYRSQEGFRECPSCRRVYWDATHVTAIRNRLAEMIGAKASLDGVNKTME